MSPFRALLVETSEDGAVHTEVRTLDDDDLMTGSVTVDVHFSSLNFKDALAITGRSPVIRRYPLVPGIDLVGRVRHSDDPRWSEGDLVVLNGAGIGESHHGGLAQRARVPGGSLVRVPERIGAARAAAIGTAGFTAMLAVLALERGGVTPALERPVVVTGAAGGVGSVAVALLANLGYSVTASTGRLDTEGDFLRRLGAREVIHRDELSAAGKPLQSQRWSGAVDSVGGSTLATVLAQTEYGGTVAACGLAQSTELATTVMPFILRAVSLVGVNSVDAPLALRERAWQRLSTDLDLTLLDDLASQVTLEEALTMAPRLLQGQVRGRTVVDVNA